MSTKIKFTLHNLQQIKATKQTEKASSIRPFTPSKMETSSNTKGSSKAKGFIQKLEIIKDEPDLQKIYLQKLMNDHSNVSEPASTTKPKTCDLQDLQDTYDI